MLSENRAAEGLAIGLRIADNLTLSHLTDLGLAFVLPSRQAAAASRWMERIGIRSAGPRQPVGELSGGNQQKVALARLLHHDVDLLVSTSRRADRRRQQGADLRAAGCSGGWGAGTAASVGGRIRKAAAIPGPAAARGVDGEQLSARAAWTL